METSEPLFPQPLLEEARSVAVLTGHHIRIIIPSILQPGEPFSARISVVQRDGLPPPSFPHTLRFNPTPGLVGLPTRLSFDPDLPVARIEELSATSPGVMRLAATVETAPARGIPAFVASNPAWVVADPPARLYWGDLHIHTHYSNCSGWRCLEPEWAYRYARDLSFLDFAAAADHLRGIAADPRRWPVLQSMASTFHQPGRFVAFLAFESSHAQGYGGDNNVYFLHDNAPYFWLERADMKGIAPAVPLETLWAHMDAARTPYFTAPHHTGRAHKYRAWDEPRYDPEREPLFEIYSSWGSSEVRHSRYPICGGNNEAPSYFVDALKAGARFGVIASSDDHATLPGAIHAFRGSPFGALWPQGYAHQGLAAVWAPSLDRPALVDSLRRRATYATTYARTLLDVRIGEARMGETIPADARLRRRRRIEVRFTLDGEARSAILTLIRNGQPIAREVLSGLSLAESLREVAFDDADDLEAIALRNTPFHPTPFAVYYLRLEEAHGGTVWSSPIWLDIP
jgi:hypothetical protein